MHCLCAIISESRQKRVYTLQAAAAAVTTSYLRKTIYKGCSDWMMKKSYEHSLVRNFFSWGEIFWTCCMHNFVAVGVEKVAWECHLSSWIAWVSQYISTLMLLLRCLCVCVCVRALVQLLLGKGNCWWWSMGWNFVLLVGCGKCRERKNWINLQT